MNDPERGRPWSKYSKESSSYQIKNGLKNAKSSEAKPAKLDKKEAKRLNKEKKLELLVGDLNQDDQFKEFLAANKAISSKENIWKNDFNLNLDQKENSPEQTSTLNVIFF